MVYGSKPVDNQHFIFTKEEKDEFLRIEPLAKKFIRQLVSTKEFLSGKERYCLWLKDALPSELKDLPEIRNRIAAVRKFRLASKKDATRELASTPYLFAEIRQPTSRYIAIPLHTSENRDYVPMGFSTILIYFTIQLRQRKMLVCITLEF